ncbi:hypothetical protein Musp01_28040 [Muricauda sp. NBRC 101325]|nr:hypothetical protein Musp01_28040 [Muricauda sp. NBRC 101325]
MEKPMKKDILDHAMNALPDKQYETNDTTASPFFDVTIGSFLQAGRKIILF